MWLLITSKDSLQIIFVNFAFHFVPYQSTLQDMSAISDFFFLWHIQHKLYAYIMFIY